MSNKHMTYLAIFLLIISGILLSLSVVYYDFMDKAVSYRYSDDEEYSNIKLGLDFIEKLPIQFNITNQYFSGFDNLSEDVRQTILIAYAFKNNYKTYFCGSGNQAICIDKESLNNPLFLEKFNSTTRFISNSLNVYLDDYGMYTINSTDKSSFYRVILDNGENNFRKYSKFSHYKEDGDMYIFYIREGYYEGNCKKGEKLDLYDFMDGKVKYSDVCNGNQEFVEDPNDSINSVQMYKYELKKDGAGKFYLFGYNPVNG